MRLFLCYFLVFFLISAKAQTITVYGLITNSESDSLANAVVKYGKGAISYVRSRSDGTYEFKIDLADLKELEVIFVAHDKLRYIITKNDLSKIKNSGLELNFELFDRVLQEVIVGANLPDTFFRSDDFSVADFEMDAQNQIVLLTYPKKLQKGSHLKLLDSRQQVIDSYYFSGKAIELKTDYRKNIHFITKDKVYLVVIQNNKIHLLEEDSDHYFRFIAPILDTLDDNLYYSNYSKIYPAFDYFQFNKSDSVYTHLMGVIDEPMMEQYRAEYKFSDVRTRLWASNKELSTGVDKEVWVGAAIFSNSIYYEPLYAPLFVNNDTVVVFDHYKSLLFKYSNDLNYRDSMPIVYHENESKTGWEQPLIQDKVTGRIYVLFERNGNSYLSLVNLQTGKIQYSRKLYFKYIEKLHIVDNQIYYIYRPFESIQKKYIYREVINLD